MIDFIKRIWSVFFFSVYIEKTLESRFNNGLYTSGEDDHYLYAYFSTKEIFEGTTIRTFIATTLS